MPHLHLHPTHPNHYFLDGDNFLWHGTLEMYGEMFAQLLVSMAGRRTDPELHDFGRQQFLNTLHLSDRERFAAWQKLLLEKGHVCTFCEEDFLKFVQQYFMAHYRSAIRPADAVDELLGTLSQQRAEGVPLMVHLLSQNMDFALPLIVQHFGWQKHFNGQLLGAPFLSDDPPRSKADRALTHLSAGAGLVVIAGDSTGDIAAGHSIAERGFEVVTLAAATGVHSLAELQSRKPTVVVGSLRELVSVLQQLGATNP